MSPCLVGPTSAGTTVPSGLVDVEQHRLGGHVHVPQVVMHRSGAPISSAPVLMSSATIEEEYFSTLSLRPMPSWSGTWLPSGM